MSSTHRELVAEGYFVTIQHCEEPGCDRNLGVNYPSDWCDVHRDSYNDATILATGDPLTEDQHVRFEAVIRNHEVLDEDGDPIPLDRDYLAYVCLDCGSIGMNAARDDRDLFVENYDTTCCDPNTTVILHSAVREKVL